MKQYLLTPGPTPLAPEVLTAFSKPIIYHRAPEFKEIFVSVISDLKRLLLTQESVILFASSGTGAMEASVSNFLSKKDKAVAVIGGKFGERWAEILKAYNVEFLPLNIEWGMPVKEKEIYNFLKNNPSITALYIQATETSTGVVNPIGEIGMMLKDKFPEVLFVVDAISAFGVYEIKTDEWGIDILVGGSQKGLMLPPGLALLTVSKKAWKFNEKSDLPHYYFDVKKEEKSYEKSETAYTPAVSHIVALKSVLEKIKKEGREKIFERNTRIARATRNAIISMGLELFAPHSPSPSITAVKSPSGIDSQEIVKRMRERGFFIAGGQSQLKGKIFRIGHMGFIDEGDILAALLNLEDILCALGFSVERGISLKAFANEWGK